ncbi:hypothetical protein EBESD8_52050 [Rhodococcus aetherivorans]|nr:hypothetical protein EBESD8_52050 [Rhodococcus aetherivorans]
MRPVVTVAEAIGLTTAGVLTAGVLIITILTPTGRGLIP